MTNAWFHAFTTPRMSAHSKQSISGSSQQGRRVAARFDSAVMLLLALLAVGNVGLVQELDSSVMQKEAEKEAAKAAKQTQQPPASQNQPPQAASPQDHPQTTPGQGQQQIAPSQANQPGQSSFMLPPGTKLPLGLLRSLRVKPGRDVYLQITFPVTVGSEMIIPPGTYIQGVVEKIIRKDRRHDALEFTTRSASMIFLNGYTVPITGTVRVATANAALLSPGPGNNHGQPSPAMAAVGGVAPPALPPLPDIGKGARTAMIAIGVVGAVAVTAGLVIAANRDPEMEAGTPLEIVLPAPVFLDAGRVMAAVQQFNQQAGNAPVQIVQPPVKPRICYDPGSPGTPDTVIPGSPGTPDTVIPGVNGMPDTVIPGSPRTPDTVIPGTPGTPSSSYPCPK